jgi:SAM-dependent methyltransferase
MTDAGYFDRLYAAQDDPWDLSTSGYERRKLGLLMAELPRPRYRHAFEPGCATGLTTAMLAQRCDQLTAMDIASAAVRQARDRVRDCAGVAVVQGRLPDAWPAGCFDLVVVSELLYYLDQPARREVADRIIATLEPSGDLIAVHWRHPFVEAACTGDEVHIELAERLLGAGLRMIRAHVEDDFRLEVFRQAAGLGDSEESDTLCQR